ncbi:LPS export ABC transporter permease LptF [Aquabacterium sp.]|uniref:LPS export ABC transporter permease LptF n=1 Tax=Aquabacterium sp. TaxID=1872578 RepID=UPI0035B3E482
MLFDSSVRKELARSFGATLVVLLTIVLTMLLIRMLGLAAKGSVAASDVTLLLGYTVIAQLPMLLNLSLFVSVVSALSRMYRESEMVVWFASGVRLRDFVRPVLRLSWPVFFGMLAVVALVRPWAQSQSAELKDRYERRSDLSRVAAGQFQTSRSGNRVFFIDRETQQSQLGRNVFILSRDKGEESVTTAQSGHIVYEQGKRLLVLDRGQRVVINDKTQEKLVSRFDEARIAAGDGTQTGLGERPPAARTTFDLLTDDTNVARGELVWRVGQVFTTLNLLLLGVCLAAGNPRRGGNWNLISALLAFVVYFNLLNLSQAWVASGKFRAAPTLVSVHGIIFTLALLWIWWRDGGSASWPRLRLAR